MPRIGKIVMECYLLKFLSGIEEKRYNFFHRPG